MAAFTSQQSGDWSVPSGNPASPWYDNDAQSALDRSPTDGDSATIALGHTVDIDGDITLGTNPANQSTNDLVITGTLNWKTTAGVDWTFTMKGNVQLTTNGTFQIGSAAAPIPASSTATWYMPLGATVLWRLSITGGTFRTYGATAYHMGDANKQRTTLAAAITLGNDKTIEFVDDVDYEVGDEVWVAKGGRLDMEMWTDNGAADIGNWGIEKITLKTKVNASTYTADFTYDHEANDMAFGVERNVFFQCEAGKAFQVYLNTVADGTWTIDTNWTRYSPQYTAYVFYLYNVLITDNFIAKNVVFDTDDSNRASAINFDRFVIVDIQNKEIDNVHIGGFLRGLYFGFTSLNDGGRVVMGNITCFSRYHGLSFKYQVVVDSLWYCAIGTTGVRPDSTYAEGFEALGGSFHFKEVKIHCHAEIYIHQRTDERHCVRRIDGGEIYHAINNGMWIYDSRNYRVEVRNVAFADTKHDGIKLQESSTALLFENCSFDNMARNGGSTSGVFSPGTTATPDDNVIFRECTFGTNVRNNMNLSFTAAAGASQLLHRIICEKCTFKIQTRSLAAADYTYWPEPLYWICDAHTFESWSSQGDWNPDRTLELVDPIALNASDVDQWPSAFPNVTRLAVTGGGAFVMNETTTVLDGTIGVKIEPLATFGRNCCNMHFPLRIPVDTGETLTVKLSFQKDTTMPAGRRPALHMRVPGAQEVLSEMSDVIGSWEELQVGETALLRGFAEIWCTAGSNEQSLTVNWVHPKVRGTRNVYIDGFSVERS